MTSNEEDLYYACMNFCESFFHMMCEKYKVRWNEEFFRYDNDTRDRIIEYEENRLKHSFDRLCEVIDRIKKE